MGVKAMSELLGMQHILCRDGGRWIIGSSYVSELIIIDPDYSVRWGKLGPNRGNKSLQRYYKILTGMSQEEIGYVLNSPDTYRQLHPVWMSRNGRVIKKYCEKPGWPNVTVDGELMYENTFYSSRKQALQVCRESALYRIKFLKDAWRETRHAVSFMATQTATAIQISVRAWLFFGRG